MTTETFEEEDMMIATEEEDMMTWIDEEEDLTTGIDEDPTSMIELVEEAVE